LSGLRQDARTWSSGRGAKVSKWREVGGDAGGTLRGNPEAGVASSSRA
jgi:hypothetical protein